MQSYDKSVIPYWEPIREKGRVHYALTHGIKTGLFLFVAFLLISLFTRPVSEVFLSYKTLAGLVLSLGLNMLYYATIRWNLFEKDYQAKKPTV